MISRKRTKLLSLSKILRGDATDDGKLCCRWRGSIYKLLWKDFLLYVSLYYTFTVVYHVLLNSEQRRSVASFMQVRGGRKKPTGGSRDQARSYIGTRGGAVAPPPDGCFPSKRSTCNFFYTLIFHHQCY